MTACEHQWEWTQPRIVTIDLGVRAADGTGAELAKVHESYNARCSKCGATTWAHGWNVPAPTHPGPRDPVLEQEC